MAFAGSGVPSWGSGSEYALGGEEVGKLGGRADFGENWEAVVQDWCLGNRPSIAAEDGWHALGVLERLWPERLEQTLSSSSRGPLIVVALVEAGLTIDACKDLAGFDEVFKRLKGGERAAESELRLAAALVGLDYAPTLEPRLEGKRLDARISVGSHTVYFEVSTPEHADPVRQAWDRMSSLSSKLAELNPGANTSVYLLSEPTPEVWDEIVDLTQTLTATPTGTVAELPGVGYVRTAPAQAELPSLDALSESVRAPRLYAATAARIGGIWARAEVSLPLTDERAGKLMHRELSHFSRSERNVLVIFVAQVVGGVKAWVPLIQRRFQAKINRRCGAVVVVEGPISAVGPAVQLKSRVLTNPHAYMPVPQALLEQLGSLPNWWRT